MDCQRRFTHAPSHSRIGRHSRPYNYYPLPTPHSTLADFLCTETA